MNYRKLIYIFTAIAFLPAALLFVVSMALAPTVVFSDLSKGHWETAILLIPLFGGGAGIVAAILVTFDIAGNSLSAIHIGFKRLGLVFGIVSELAVISWFTPNMEPFLYYWLPQLFGGVVLLALSYSGLLTRLSN